MNFSSLDPQLQGAIIGGAIAGVVAVVVALLGGAGWLVRHWLQGRQRRRDLRRIKLQHVMERLIELYDWYSKATTPSGGAHPGDHILWLCEAYGRSPTLTEAATKLRDACDEAATLLQVHEVPMTPELQQRFDALNENYNSAYRATRAETLRILRSLA